ncbi:AAA domain-containing protein [Candidatus Poriferisocius sp.]|uniref:AAA domain-containing protein n=1 Tax=Candidatus Poriferisocius sp. TaxID=3101276 RepID=UPI003B5ADBB9
MSRMQTVERAAEKWAKDLTDESGRNLLLYYKELKSGTLSLDQADPKARARLQNGRRIRAQDLFPDDLFDDALRRIRTVKRKAVFNFEEKGINTLFVGWGMATWTPVSSSATPAAPVLLSPVSLERTGASEIDFDIQLSGDWTLNEALLFHLSHEFKVDVAGDSLLDPFGDGEQISQGEEKAIFAELLQRAARVPDFDIAERVVLGNFMFKKMPMVNDIRDNVEALARHDVIAAIAGDDEAGQSLRNHHVSAVDPSLPDRTPPRNEFLVLDADSSQNLAINAAMAGESFVLQGPPGTGKSQTISNLIATMMAEGKSVLFVAEKRAAIDAVVKRLTSAGLDRFVMDLHGGVSSRKKLAGQLNDSLAEIARIPPVDLQDLHRKVENTRKELSGYSEALHQPHPPWNMSYFDVQKHLLGLEAGGNPTEGSRQPPMWFPAAALSDLGRDAADGVRRDLKDWVDLSEPLRSGTSPWAGARITAEAEARSASETCRELVGNLIPQWLIQQPRLQQELGITEPESVREWQGLTTDLHDLSIAIAKTDAVLSPEVFHRDLDQLVEEVTPAAKPWVLRLFDKRCKAAMETLDSLLAPSSTLSRRAAVDAVVAARTQDRRWSELGCSGSPRVSAAVGQAHAALAAVMKSVDFLSILVPTQDFARQSAEDILAIVRRLLDDQQTLFSLPQMAELEQRLRQKQVGPLLDKVNDGSLPPEDLERAFDHSWLRSIHQELHLNDGRLSGFRGTRQTRYVAEFMADDKAHLGRTAARVARRIAEHAVAALNRFPDQDELIRKEANKKTRHLPLAKLFQQAPEALLALRPCWAMSPLDVAQTLPPRPLFDLVVFDEASQVMPCDAISALLRGHRTMVAGDSRQLPPTTFFDSSGGTSDDLDEDEESLSDYDSILDVMDARLSRRPLSWHYRSQDERLIAYSNQEIYHGSLTTFPGASADRCVTWELVPHRPGMAVEKGSSSDEVLRVVDLMLDHAQQRPQESLGVIAMGIHHANRIEEALRQRLQHDSDEQLEEFFHEAKEEKTFVKNLERVQGDERDAIILSIGYGKNADGQMVYRFGPLNMQGGERRLNVAITRARKRMTLVSSFAHSDLDPGRTTSTGAEMLRGFLKFAQSGGTELDGARDPAELNPFEIDVRDKLTAAGLDVVPQHGCSGYRIDFAVRHPTRGGQFALAVEADGASYHSSPTARDRDRLRQEHLERLGWRFCRIWSTDWFNDHRGEVDRVLSAFHQAVADIDSGKITPPGAPVQSSPADRGFGVQATLPERGPQPFIGRHDSIAEYSQASLIRLAQWIMSDGLLRTDDQLFEEMFAKLGFKRRGPKIREVIGQAILEYRVHDSRQDHERTN